MNAGWVLLHQLVVNAVLALGASEDGSIEAAAHRNAGHVEIVLRRSGAADRSKKSAVLADREEARREAVAVASFLRGDAQFEPAGDGVRLLLAP